MREELLNYISKRKNHKENYHKVPDFDDFVNMIEIEDDDNEAENQTSRKRLASGSATNKGMDNVKKPRHKGPMDSFVYQKLEKVVQLRKQGKLKQTNIQDACDKKKREEACQYIARLLYQARIPFNVANSDAFKCVVEAIGHYGPNLKPPSYHELRVSLLKKELAYTDDLFKSHEEAWVKHGCSVMSDGWTD